MCDFRRRASGRWHPDFRDFESDAIRQVFEAVAPVLRIGLGGLSVDEAAGALDGDDGGVGQGERAGQCDRLDVELSRRCWATTSPVSGSWPG